VQENARITAEANDERVVIGYTTSTALIEVVDTMLNKPGGYLSNDVAPPGVLMDNIPSWEFGVLEMSRDLALAMRRKRASALTAKDGFSHLLRASTKRP